MSEHVLMFNAILHTEAVGNPRMPIHVHVVKRGVLLNSRCLMASSVVLSLLSVYFRILGLVRSSKVRSVPVKNKVTNTP